MTIARRRNGAVRLHCAIPVTPAVRLDVARLPLDRAGDAGAVVAT
jgi:hypothetical protein